MGAGSFVGAGTAAAALTLSLLFAAAAGQAARECSSMDDLNHFADAVTGSPRCAAMMNLMDATTMVFQLTATLTARPRFWRCRRRVDQCFSRGIVS